MPKHQKLINPFAHIPKDDRPRVQCAISKELFTYFFRQVLPDYGCPNALLATFLVRLHEECLKRGIPPVWTEDAEGQVAQIMSDLNFQKHGPTTKSAKPRPRRPNVAE